LLRIRLARTGKKKQASYRVVVADRQRAVTSKFVEILGWYNPHSKEIVIDKAKVEGWLEKGANPSNTLAILLEKEGVKLPKWVKIEKKSKKPKKKEVKAEAKPVVAKEEKPGDGKEAEVPVAEETAPAEVEGGEEVESQTEEVKEASTEQTEGVPETDEPAPAEAAETKKEE